jgi:hypothetical protein
MRNRRFSGDAEYTSLLGCDTVSDERLGVSKDHCNEHTEVEEFLRNTDTQETECLSTSVICVPPFI